MQYRRLRLLALFALLSWLALPPHSAQTEPGGMPNPIANPGFDDPGEGLRPPWEATLGPGASLRLDNAQFVSAGNGLCVEHPQATTSVVRQAVGLPAAEALVLAARVRTEGIRAGGAGGGVRVAIEEPGGKRLAESLPMAGTQPWGYATVAFRPGGARRVRVVLALENAAGQAWLDDVLLTTPAAWAALRPADPSRDPRENLALGKKCGLYPSPNYEHCTDPDDVTQLTDGRYTEGYFWTQQSTVGWHRGPSAIALIDLGQVFPIDAVSFRGPAGGRAGVYAMAGADVFVSDDGDRFHLAGQTRFPNLPETADDLFLHRFSADGLKTRGRYVLLRFLRGRKSSFIFTDEVEVRRGAFDPSRVTLQGTPERKWDLLLAQINVRRETYTLAAAPETPHVKWARPLAGGPLRVVWLASSEMMRPAVEMAQRLEMDHRPVSHFVRYSTAPLGSIEREQIAEALPAAEVMVIADIRRACIPPEVQEAIRRRVEAGMGLLIRPWGVWTGQDALSPLLQEAVPAADAVPAALLRAAEIPETQVRCYRYGQGRVAVWNADAVERSAVDRRGAGAYEYPFAVEARLLRWLAGRPGALEAVECDGRNLVVRAAVPARVRAVVRGPYFDERAQLTLAPGPGGALTATPPPLDHGFHTVDILADDEHGRRVDWLAAAFQVSAPLSFVELRLDKDLYEADDPVRGTLNLIGTAPGRRLEVALSDCYGRVLEQQTLPLDAGATAAGFTLRKRSPLTLSLDLSVRLMQGERLMQEERQVVWVRLPEANNFRFLGWYGLRGEPYAADSARVYRDLGVESNAVVSGASAMDAWARENVRPGAENLYRAVATLKPGEKIRQPSLTDPELRRQVTERIQAILPAARRTGMLDFSMGDESSVGSYAAAHDLDWHPTALDGFRRYLEEQYGTLDALNRSWETAFGEWGRVVPWTRQDAEGKRNIAPWLDHRLYMESYFAEFHGWCRQEITRTIPEARVGISGTPDLNSYSGHDWWKLMRHQINHLSGYGGAQAALQRSFLTPGSFFGAFNGYVQPSVDAERHFRTQPWLQLFSGANGVNFYTIISNSQNDPLVLSDLSRVPNARSFCDEVRAIQEGPGLLLMGARCENDGLALLYSPASLHAATHAGLMDARNPLRSFRDNLSNLVRVTRDSGLQLDFVSGEQVEGGALQRYRALVLPWNACLSEKEAAAIRAFVTAGGTVIADALCGKRDGHGRPVAGSGALDDLFGIVQPEELPTLEWADLSCSEPKLSARVAGGYAGLKLAGGKALATVGGIPALIIRPVGRGRAVFLNFSLSNYGSTDYGGLGETVRVMAAAPEVASGIRRLWRHVLGVAGVQASASFAGAGGAEHPTATFSRFRDGNALYLGAAEMEAAGPADGRVDPKLGTAVRITLPAPAHLYDARAARYLGRGTAIEDRLTPGLPRLYAALPYRVTAIAVQAPATAAAGQGATVDLRVRTDGQPGRHVLHLAVIRPDGTPFRPYGATLEAPGGRCRATIPFALNDARGKWTLRATDAATGTQAEATIVIR